MKLRARETAEIATMVKTMGCGEVESKRPTRALDPAAIDIWIKPSRAEAVPAILGKGRSATAIELGKTRPRAVENNIMGIM